MRNHHHNTPFELKRFVAKNSQLLLAIAVITVFVLSAATIFSSRPFMSLGKFNAYVFPKICKEYYNSLSWDFGVNHDDYIGGLLVKNLATREDFEKCLTQPLCEYWTKHSTKFRKPYDFKYDGWSQDGQDRYLDSNVFRGKENGVLVEIGAFDGVSGSNSYLFEKCRNWRSILVEANPRTFSILDATRRTTGPNPVLVQKCISNFEGTAMFTMAVTLSGLPSKYSVEHKNRVENEVDKKEHNVTVQCTRLATLLKEHNIHHVDLLLIDIEGGEPDVLKTIEEDNLDIDVVVAENNYPDKIDFGTYLAPIGYKKVERLSGDEFWVKRTKFPHLFPSS